MMLFLFDTIQRSSSISFPFLGNWTIDPPAFFTVFGMDIYFYGLMIGLGFLSAILYCSHRAPEFGISSDDFYSMMLWLMPLSIVGARLYYVLFQLDYYLQHPGEFLAIRNGGLAIYGGLIGGAAAVVIAMLDLMAFGVLIGQILGRWGNFFNREAFGAETDIFCRMGLTSPEGSTIYVHPTFLYESLWNLAGLIFLIVFTKKGKRKYDGQCILIYFFWYGLGRAWIEGLRTDSLYIGSTGIRVSQLLSVVLVLVTGILLIRNGRKPHSPEDLFANRPSPQTASADEGTDNIEKGDENHG